MQTLKCASLAQAHLRHSENWEDFPHELVEVKRVCAPLSRR